MRNSEVVEKTQFPNVSLHPEQKTNWPYSLNFQNVGRKHQLHWIAIGSFGPIDTDPNSENIWFCGLQHQNHIGLNADLPLSFMDYIKSLIVLFHLFTIIDAIHPAYGRYNLFVKGAKSPLRITLSECIEPLELFKIW